ncbi:MAG: TetR/AcrR family transcriptional regulator [Pseudomonadota bacterium]
MIAAAVELILTHGTARTTLAAIGERAGYSRGLATYRFGSKGGLFEAVCRVISRRWLSYLEAEVGAKVGIEAMCAATDAYFRWVRDNPEHARALQILYTDAAQPGSEFRSAASDSYTRQRRDVADWVRRGIADGTVRADADPASEAARFVAFIAGMTYQWLLTPEALDFEAIHRDFKQQIRRTLQP